MESRVPSSNPSGGKPPLIQSRRSNSAVRGMLRNATGWGSCVAPARHAADALLVAFRSFRFADRKGCRSRFLGRTARLLSSLFFAFFALLFSFCVGDVAELLHPPRKHLRSENSVVLVRDDACQALELPGHQTMSAEADQQLVILVENLDSILLSVRNPNVPIGIDRDPFWPREISRSVARFPERADELAIGIKDLECDCSGCRKRIDFPRHPPQRRSASQSLRAS